MSEYDFLDPPDDETPDATSSVKARAEKKTKTDKESKPADPAQAGPADDKDADTEQPAPYKKAFYILLAFFALSLLFFCGVSYFTHKAATKFQYYEEMIGETQAVPVTPATDDGIQKINVNTATQEELIALPGIGETKAKAIIAYREEYGIITGPEDLLKIEGIGQSTVKKIAPYLVFE